jgi:NADH:ubiquinone oxidoreductase subunit D
METKLNRVWTDDTAVYIETSDGKVFSEKFEDYPRLRYATPVQRAAFEYNNVFIRWEELDEDLSIEGFMKKHKTGNELYRIFKEHPELNVSAVARKIGIPQSVMASYLCGIKKPSAKRLREIEDTIHETGKNLCGIRLYQYDTQNHKKH